MGEAIKEDVEVCPPMVGMEPNSLISLEEEEEDAVVVVVEVA
jgi:hypothetical protein